MDNTLVVAVPPEGNFYSLYADGLYCMKKYDKESGTTYLHYEGGTAVFLYYTYPNHRRVYLIRNEESGDVKSLPGLSKKVTVIFRQYASRVNKTKRAVSYLNAHYENAYGYSDKFYTRLSALLQRKGEIDYAAIDALCKRGL